MVTVCHRVFRGFTASEGLASVEEGSACRDDRRYSMKADRSGMLGSFCFRLRALAGLLPAFCSAGCDGLHRFEAQIMFQTQMDV